MGEYNGQNPAIVAWSDVGNNLKEVTVMEEKPLGQPLGQSMLSDHFVSVVILTHFSRAHSLRRAIASAVAQTLEHFEIIVADSGHHAETQAIVENFDDARIRHHRIPQDKTVGGGRNEGVRLAKGRYVAFLDDDDEWLPTKLEKQVRLLQSNELPNVGMVTCPVWIVNDRMDLMRQEPLMQRPARGDVFNAVISLTGLTSGMIPSRATAMVFLKDALIDVGLFDEQFLCGEDWDLLIRLTQRWQINVVPEPLALCHYHYEGDRATAVAREIQSHRLLMRKHHGLLVSMPEAQANWWCLLAEDHLRSNDRHHCRTNAREAAKRRRTLLGAWLLWVVALSPPSFWVYRAFLNLRSYLGWRVLGKKVG